MTPKIGRLIALLFVEQLAWTANSWAQTTMCASASQTNPATCQWLENASNSITSLNSPAVPPSSIGGTNPVCASTQCSDGIHQKAGVVSILYDTNFGAPASSTTSPICRFVDNDSGNDLFVPQNTLAEFTAFVANAPSGVTFGYCVNPLNTSISVTPTYNGNGNTCTVLAGGSATCTTGYPTGMETITALSSTTSAANFTVGVVRLPAPGQPALTLQAQTASFTYQRQDCRIDLGDVKVCQTHQIAETDTTSAQTAPNQNTAVCGNPQQNLDVNCNGYWKTSTISLCYVDGSTTPTSCPPAFIVPLPSTPSAAWDGLPDATYASGEAPPVGDPPNFTLAYETDFSQPLDSSWSVMNQPGGGSTVAAFAGSECSESNGVMQFALTNQGGGNWAACGIFQNKGLSQTYGKYLIRFRADGGAGVSPTALLWPTNDSWPPEVDLFQNYAGTVGTMQGDEYFGSGGVQAAGSPALTSVENQDYTQWHTMGIEWTPGSLVYTIDGTVWSTLTNGNVPSIPMELALHQELAFISGSTPASSNLDVNWVAEYAYTPGSGTR